MKKSLLFLSLFLFAAAAFATNPVLVGNTEYGGLVDGGNIMKIRADGSGFTNEYAFHTVGSPTSDLLKFADNKFYGMTFGGGTNNGGTIFTYNPNTGTFNTIYNFSPSTGVLPGKKLMLGSNGKLYGCTEYGGNNNKGVLFEITTDGANYSVLHHFAADGSEGIPSGSLVQSANGKLWGTTRNGGTNGSGTIFNYDFATDNYSLAYSFGSSTGTQPSKTLAVGGSGVDERLYGVTKFGGSNGAGVIFSFEPLTSSNYSVIHNFDLGPDGGYPEGSIIYSNDGSPRLFGMTTSGGSYNFGTIFQQDLFGPNYFGNIFTFGAQDEQAIGDLFAPNPAALSFYGTTTNGGGSGNGIIFKLEYNGGWIFSVVYEMQDAVSGFHPRGSLIGSTNGKLYGINRGGNTSSGVLFEFDPAGAGTYVKKKDFDPSNGTYPGTGMVQAPNGRLYGTTSMGGAYGLGVLYKYDPFYHLYTVLHDFNGTDGKGAYNVPIAASNGKIYGTTSAGGDYDLGVIYSYDMNGGNFAVEHSFNDTAGRDAWDLMQASNGKIYGTTVGGGSGANHSGVLFRFDPSNGSYIVLWEFVSATGVFPYSKLIEKSPNLLYGTTGFGGVSDIGLIFSYNISTDDYTVVKDFAGTAAGAAPTGPLALLPNGDIYGTTYFSDAGNIGNGKIFKYVSSTNNLTLVHEFNGNEDGLNPFMGGLLKGSDGILYGSAYGGTNGNGVVFSLNPASSAFSTLISFDGLNGSSIGRIMELDTIFSGVSELQADSRDLLVYPNPGQQDFIVQLAVEMKNAHLEIVNSLGEIIYTEEISNSPGGYTGKIHLDVTAGIYVVRVINAEKQLTKRISIQ